MKTELPINEEATNSEKDLLADGLSIDQAKRTAMIDGKKIRHRHFTDYEHIYFKNGCWFTEDNYQIPESYWKHMDENWHTGWSYVD